MSNKLRILVTGANGFIGNAVVNALLQHDYEIIASTRSASKLSSVNIEKINIGTISLSTNWDLAIKNVDTIIHTAARVHVMDESEPESLEAFRSVNTAGTLKLASQAAEARVRRFIFISSVKVNGEMTVADLPFRNNENMIPTDSYGLSKYEAEQGLLKLAKETGMEVVIVRPPLVYGPGVTANFAKMMSWVNKQVPLPLGAINNCRSLVALENLTSFIIHCIEHPKAINEVFLISDDEDVSTTELLRRVAKSLGRRAILLPIPVNIMIFSAKLIGKREMAVRLFSSLQVDSSKARKLLGWKPVITMDEQLKKTADAYLNETTL